jgi:anti-anti-sigma regulatory factor
VIFSLFGKKGGRGADRKRAATEPSARSGPPSGGAARSADPREIARLTAAKIDEIESEMIASSRPAAAPVAAARVDASQAGLAGTVYVPSGAAVATAPASPAAPAAAPVAAARAASPAAASAGPRGARAEPPDTSVILGEANADGLSMEVGGSSLPPAFEEAAVLYSNGQSTAAATILWQAIKENTLAGHAKQGWAMLFDLYQAMGRKEDFESLAIDYSARFETSPPTWDDAIAPPGEDAARPAAGGAPSAVMMPAALDAQAVRQIEQVQRLAQRNRPVLVDLTAVRTVDAIGADLLLRVLTAFSGAQRELLVQGADALVPIVAGTIEAGRRDPSEACWLLQLELLRVLDRQQEFEDLSIDYCVTYEVSPPAWEPMPPSIRTTGAGTATAEADASSASRAAADGGFSAGPEGFALVGELAGRAQVALGALREYAADRAEVVIDCSRLRRVDFVAAGELLNEVVALRTGGKYLVFKDLNHVVAALLAVMGIPDLAEIRLRRQ